MAKQKIIPNFMKLSIIIPVYNEKDTILEILNRVKTVDVGDIEKEIIIINDGSDDGTTEIFINLENQCKVINHQKNLGKGAALRSGFKAATGDIILIQDADLEYDPKEYSKLIEPILNNDADVVYGSRFLGGESKRVLFFRHSLGNRFLTFLSNIFTDLTLTDMETCYKVFSQPVIQTILPELKSDRFEIEPELTARVAKHNFRIYEVGISYKGRTYKEGKKIDWKDGMKAIWYILKYNLWG
jgi:glycosyltransferase involved in cell wall biosynthesis